MQRVLALVLSKYFIHQYEFQSNDRESKIQLIDPWSQRVLERNLQRFNDDTSEQLIEIELEPEPTDIANIQTIGNNLDRFNEQLSFWEGRFDSYPPAALATQIAESKSLTYRIINLALQPSSPRSAEWGFAEYLRTFFIFMRLAER